MKVTFELKPKDIRYFRERLKQVRKTSSEREDEAVIAGAAQLVVDAREADPPEFVVDRITKLEQLIEMLRDDEWRLEGPDRVRILDALTYFVDPDDLIPDKLPGIGYLDDAIMIELVARELTHEIKAYEDFCAYRKQRPKSEGAEKLASRRDALQSRMRRRRRRERSVARSSPKSTRSPLRLF